MWIVFLAVSFFASLAGAICGIGGGVIIKPVLDATGVMNVSQISFLSGCTVLSMSLISVGKSLKNKNGAIELRQGTALAVGAAAGGMLGKWMFQYACASFANMNQVGVIQSSVLFLITALTMIYTLREVHIRTWQLKSLTVSLLIGLLLGVISSFLGIGGGPINLMVLSFFFSMDMKKAAANSLYIILFSQLTSLLQTIATRSIPEVSPVYLVFMVGGGVAGGMLGGKVNKTIEEKQVKRLFVLLMVLILAVNVYNIWKGCHT